MNDTARLVNAPATLTFVTAAQIEADLLANIVPGCPVNCSLAAVDHIDSAGVALLVAFWQQARKFDAPVVFTAVPAKMTTILELCGLQGVLPLAD